MKQLALLSFVILTACSQAASSDERSVIEAHVAGFNARDIDAMRTVQHSDAQWWAVDGSGASLITDDREAWNAIMRDTFESSPDLRGELRDWSIAGDRVAVVEVAVTTDASGRTTRRETLTAYQIEDGKIRRVWYFMED